MVRERAAANLRKDVMIGLSASKRSGRQSSVMSIATSTLGAAVVQEPVPYPNKRGQTAQTSTADVATNDGTVKRDSQV